MSTTPNVYTWTCPKCGASEKANAWMFGTCDVNGCDGEVTCVDSEGRTYYDVHPGARRCVCATCGKVGNTTLPDPVYCGACLDAKPLKPGQRLATCRICGAKGIEDADDPAPGICPDCLESSLVGAL